MPAIWIALKPGVDVTLTCPALKELSVANRKPEPPAGHVIVLESEEIQCRPLWLRQFRENHGTVAIEGHLAIGRIMADDTLVLSGESQYFFVEGASAVAPVGLFG